MKKKRVVKKRFPADLCMRCAGGGQAREWVGSNLKWTTCSKCGGTGKISPVISTVR
jgi:DnaJ-class molecular chaperone